eukprot:3705641-Amphidinium_carterae.2
MDCFFLKLHLEDGVHEIAVLSMICQGTNWHVCVRLDRCVAQAVWSAYVQHWVRAYGVPDAVLTDGGSEFAGVFSSGLERQGVLQMVSDPESPWQNGRAERHGGWVKERIESEAQQPGSCIRAIPDLDLLLAEVVSAKNRYLSRAGCSPEQLVFGRSLTWPGELLQEREVFEVPMHPGQGPGEQEAERAGMIRRKARELAFQKDSRARLAMSCKHSPHRDRIFHPGQWVYVYRKNPRAAAAEEHPLRQQPGAWRGPGLVLLQTGHTVWIAMRSRLWRCNSDQVRNAAAAETLGTEMVSAGQFRELMSHIRTSHGASALDVSKEGAPPHGSEPDEIRPEGDIQVESQSIADQRARAPAVSHGVGIRVRDEDHP